MKYLLFILMLIIFAGCSGNKDENNNETDNDTSYVNDEMAEVKVQVLQYSNFSKEIICNGKLSAFQKADLRFRTSENISRLYFKNGDRVAKGQIIATLDNFTLRNILKQNKEQFERAKLDLQDLLIGQGYSIADTASIPKSTFLAARIKSGYDKALADLEMAQFNLEQSVLKAPFNGIVANLVLKENNLAVSNDKFCMVIDNSKFEAEFMVLENELASLRKGQSVKVFPYAIGNFEFVGQVSQINPFVDNNGMVTVKAICSNKENMLAEGMNVRVIIEDKVSKQLVIPKQAVVLRSEKKVVFTMQNGLAKWNYVKTELENSTSITITEGLKAGDTVIVEGNLNLAHDSKVKISME
jgi:RND family efflux transporter MFP subunit